MFAVSKDDYLFYNNVREMNSETLRGVAESVDIKKVIIVPIAFNHTYIGLLSIESKQGNSHSWKRIDAITSRMIGRLVGTVLRPIVSRENGVITIDKDVI